MKKVILAAAVCAAFATSVHAEEAKPANEVSFNAAVTSDYRYRGISQTRLKPALQGGADYVNNPTGFYLGAWASTIKWTKDAGGEGSVELDVYAGKRGQISEDFSYDVGVLRYQYEYAPANTTEIYGQLGYGPATLKYSHSTSNLFGFADSENSGYLDFSANFDIGNGFIANLHAGRQSVRHNAAAEYTDWKIGATRDLGFATLAAAVIGTNADKSAYASPANGKFLGKTALQLTLSKTF